MPTRLLPIPIIFTILLLATLVHADPVITGKVVSISDGDTVTVLQDRTQHRIRLYGIDCPESHQDFGRRAMQFVSDLIFRENVKVVQKDVDRYGRVVGIIYHGNVCVNEEIIRAGYAWVYRHFCKDEICQDWLTLEEEARKSRIGLWSHPAPIPPWDFRRGKRGPSDEEGLVYQGNVRSKVFHQPACEHYNCKNCTAIFTTREETVGAGYRSCGGCGP
ncbi:MAG: nuclease [Candidatus Aegiribacteria sp. MLS_C]|jgi:micrococcal nuclease|nr:MAG: nuclease [Candidatus Aegiribacteria sp. MLS_C]